MSESSKSTARDLEILLPQGTLFGREWTPSPVPPAKTPIILLHDSLGSVDLWRDFPQELCEVTQRRVIAFDRLGYGKSDPRGADLPLTFVSEEADVFGLQIRDFLEIEKFVAFGHSIGGSIALAAAIQYSDSCVAVISESAQILVEEKTLQALGEARKSFATPEEVERLKKYHSHKADWVLNAWLETWLHPDFKNWSLQPELSKIQCPTLVLQGDKDEYETDVHIEQIAALVSGPCEKLFLEGCGHIPHKEKPEIVFRAVQKFLKNLD